MLKSISNKKYRLNHKQKIYDSLNKDFGLRSKYFGIFTRCNNKNNKDYKNYGGRGIKCKWNKYIEFYRDMYPSYLIHLKKYGRKNTTIERINVNGNYCLSNCKWITQQEQHFNTRNSIIYRGICATEASRKLGGCDSLVLERIRHGWDIKKAFTKKVGNYKKHA